MRFNSTKKLKMWPSIRLNKICVLNKVNFKYNIRYISTLKVNIVHKYAIILNLCTKHSKHEI